MKYLPLAFIFGIFILPDLVSAAGFVTCNGPDCSLCNLVEMANIIIKWLIGVMMIVFAIIFVSAGMKLVTSGGNPAAKTDAKEKLTNAIIGLIIVLAGWLLVDTLMRALLKGGTGQINGVMWTTVTCQSQALTGPNRIYHPISNGSRGLANGQPTGTLTPAQIASLAALNSNDDKVEQAGTNAGLNAEQIKNLQALMRVESGSCTNNVSAVGALGCMQIMPQTAVQYDPSLKGLSDAEIEAKLLDSSYNIALGAQIYADLNKTYSGDEEKIFAAYNGGTGANSASNDCPGQMRWECVWDSPGCYGTSNSSCKPNTGYAETRAYVDKVVAVADSI